MVLKLEPPVKDHERPDRVVLRRSLVNLGGRAVFSAQKIQSL
jgi:hypothetical protein